MALRNIVLEGDEILRKRCKSVDAVDDRIRVILDDMVDTMRDANGVGLAAPQVGLMRRMFVAEPDLETEKVYYMVNPEIIEVEGSQEHNEGCLSLPGLVGTVERPERIKIKALDRDGQEQTYEFEGFSAVVMCHEFDHLEGVLFTDKAKDVFEVTEGDGEE